MKLPTKAAVVAFLGDVTIALTMIAGIPFELGAAANYLDPHLKMELVKYGAFASVALKFAQRMLERLQGNQDAAAIKDNNATAQAVARVVDNIPGTPDVGREIAREKVMQEVGERIQAIK